MAGKIRASDLKVNLDELRDFKRKNFQDRLNFIEFWVDYIKKHSDEEWSKGQAALIDSQIQSARDFAKSERQKN